MAQGSTLYRFKVSLSDIDRSVYEDFEFRVAMHPSESEPFLLTRVIAYIINYEDGLEFSAGLAVPDEPSIRLPSEHGNVGKWIDIGNPSARRLHKASKAARTVRVYTYKDAGVLIQELKSEKIHRAQEVEIFSIEAKFLKALGEDLSRDNSWTVIFADNELVITTSRETYIGQIMPHRLGS